MESHSRSDIGELTALLSFFQEGESGLISQGLLEIVYDELRRKAAQLMARERPGHTLQPTALVHETYLKLLEQRQIGGMNRGQFFSIAARLMRRILVDSARQRLAEKRGSGGVQCTMTESMGGFAADDIEVIALGDAFDKLAAEDKRAAHVAELRYLVELDIDDIAKSLSISPATVKRDLIFAKAWLSKEFSK